MRLGLLGGVFDPPHEGHLAAARFARDRFSLERVELVVTCIPPHKPGRALPSPFHRYAMTALAVLGEERLAASPRELERGGLSYTIDTLREVRAESPGAEIFFILGTDQFAELAAWREPEAVLAASTLVVVHRPGADFAPLLREAPAWVAAASRQGRIVSAPMPPLPISSSEIRRRLAGGETIAGLVPLAVQQYIERCGLYRPGG